MNNSIFNRAAIAAALLVALSALGGCGSGSSDKSTAAPQASAVQTPASTAASKGEQGDRGTAHRRAEEKKSHRVQKTRSGAGSKGGQKLTDDAQSRRSRGEKVVRSLQKLVGGGGSNGAKEVVASSKKVRKIIKEAMEGPIGQGSAQHRGRSIDGVVEEVFGGR